MAAPASSTLSRGVLFGRYIILSLLGQGGMGEVYSAYDPRLDRKVALKVLRETDAPGPTRTAQERLVREAQATARLSHRNVVVVYDTGTIAGDRGSARVYLAMELVEGRTLAAWLRERPRSWRAIRDRFLAAAEGLAAAHEAGLVHRDFKPQNVMVGSDENPRVLDFGLAGDATELAEREPLRDARSSEAVTAQSIALTHTGVLLGTPIYMAPEQFLGRKTDARTDQFSFCVSLYEALYGERPFACGSLSELIAAVVTGRAREAPKRSGVPSFLRPILARGLSADPAARFASMRELMAALRADPVRRRSRAAFGAAMAVLLVAGAAGAQRLATRGQRMCRGASAKLQGIWDLEATGPRRQDLHRAFVATGSVIAEDTWTRVTALLDDYARRWTAAYRDTCEATHVRGGQSPEVMDLRMTCLDRDRGAFRALTDVLSKADARTVIDAVDAVRALPPINQCDDVPALRAVIPAPKDPQARARLSQLEAELDRVKALTDAGDWPTARQRVHRFAAVAEAFGYEPLLAETLATQGWLDYSLGDIGEGAVDYERAIQLALRAHLDELAAKSAPQVMGSLIYLGDVTGADYWEHLAAALIKRLGPGHDRIVAWFLQARGVALVRKGNLELASVDMKLALSLKRKSLPAGDPDISISLYDLACVDVLMDRGPEALTAAEEALDIESRAYGSRSPALWRAMDNRGMALKSLHRYGEAERDFRESLAFATEWVGSDHSWVADPLTDLGELLVHETKYREATPLLESAVRIRERIDPHSPDLAKARFALAEARWQLGQDRRGARLLAKAALDA